MKIGLAVTTCNRPEMLKAFIDSMDTHSITPDVFCIHDDTEHRVGVAQSKNNCLHKLQDCDLIILMDDDCHFTHPDALDFIAEGHKRTRQHHFLFMHPDHHRYVKTWHTPDCDVDLYDSCSGVFMSITKEAFQKVGYMDSRYKRYGYEHAGYSRRIHLSGLNAKPFMMLKGMDKYFRALDFEGGVKSALSEQEKAEFSGVDGHNDKIYHDELANWHNVYRSYGK